LLYPRKKYALNIAPYQARYPVCSGVYRYFLLFTRISCFLNKNVKYFDILG